MDHSTGHQTKVIHSIHPKTLDLITETAITLVTTTATTDRTSAETTAETETINNNKGTNKEIKTT